MVIRAGEPWTGSLRVLRYRPSACVFNARWYPCRDWGIIEVQSGFGALQPAGAWVLSSHASHVHRNG
jgi:hypothetical protein